MFSNVTPIGPPDKMQNNNTCNTNSFSRSHKCWQYSWVTSAPFVPSNDREQKASKVYHFYPSLYLYMMTSKNTEVLYILKYVEVLVSQYKIISFVVKVSDFFLTSNCFPHRFSSLSSLILTFELVTSISHSPNMERILKSSNFR